MSYCTLTEDKCELAKERDTLLEFWITDQISSTVLIKKTHISYNKVECITQDKQRHLLKSVKTVTLLKLYKRTVLVSYIILFSGIYFLNVLTSFGKM